MNSRKKRSTRKKVVQPMKPAGKRKLQHIEDIEVEESELDPFWRMSGGQRIFKH